MTSTLAYLNTFKHKLKGIALFKMIEVLKCENINVIFFLSI